MAFAELLEPPGDMVAPHTIQTVMTVGVGSVLVAQQSVADLLIGVVGIDVQPVAGLEVSEAVDAFVEL